MKTVLILIALIAGSATLAQTPTPKKQKTYDLNFDNVEWAKVFEWFAKESGLTYLGQTNILGKVTIKSAQPKTNTSHKPM